MTCFGQQNVNESDVCHFLAETLLASVHLALVKGCSMFLMAPYSSAWRVGPNYHLEQGIVCPWGRGGLECLSLYLLNFALWQLTYGIRALSLTELEGLGRVWRCLDQLSFPPSQPVGKALSKFPYSCWFPSLRYLLISSLRPEKFTPSTRSPRPRNFWNLKIRERIRRQGLCFKFCHD